ncbi:MAG: DNA polymerase III subunit delta [Clostridiales bacterium]|nr:DNA polymerase III subunit delta [Clostridiales bacterium]
MDYKNFLNHIKSDELFNVYIFFGKERFLIQWAIETLKKKYVDESFESLNYNLIQSGEIQGNKIINTCETLPFMSEKRMVILDDFSVLEGDKIKGFTEDEEKALADYIENLPEYCILIMTCEEKLDKRKSIYKKVSKAGCICEFASLESSDLKKWISKRFKQAGKEISNSGLTQIIDMSGYYDKDSDYTLYNLEKDIDKIVHFAGTRIQINEEDIYQTISGNIDRNIFDLIDAISLNKKDEAFRVLNNALLYGEAEYKILALLNRQFENLLYVKLLRENGSDMAGMREKLSLPDFVINKLLRSANGFSVERLKKINMKVYESDKNIKTGIMEAKLALEMLLSDI